MRDGLRTVLDAGTVDVAAEGRIIVQLAAIAVRKLPVVANTQVHRARAEHWVGRDRPEDPDEIDRREIELRIEALEDGVDIRAMLEEVAGPKVGHRLRHSLPIRRRYDVELNPAARRGGEARFRRRDHRR